MRVGGDAGDIIDGDVGEDGRTVAVGKGNRQVDHSNRINIYNDEDKPHRSRLSLEDRVMDLERLIYGEIKWSEPGLIKRQQTHQKISQWNMVVNIAMFLLMLIYLVWR